MRDRRCGAGRRGRRRSMGRRSLRQGAPFLERGCPWSSGVHGAPVSSPASASGGQGLWASRPTILRYGAAVGTRLPEGPAVRRGPARTPALHGRSGRGAPPPGRSSVQAGHRPVAPGPVWWYGCSMVKMTFSLPEGTAKQIRIVARRYGRPQSHVVREAVAEYAARADRLPEAERLRMLAVLEELRNKPTTGFTRTAEEAQAEIDAIRASRRASSLRRSRQ